jgi:Lon protease-like protein
MPMFPLGTVLLPGGVLPLHVFEPRYRLMVQRCLEDTREFGVVLIARGNEVGGGDERCVTGTVARMVQVAALADGRYAMITVGMRRIRVRQWLPDEPYPRADVEDWPDEGSVSAAAVAAVATRVRRLAALALELGDPVGDVSQELSDDPVLATYQLATLAPLGPSDRYALLDCAGPRRRLDLLDELLDGAEATLRFRVGGSDR